MATATIRDAMADLKTEIRDAVASAVAKFSAATGVTPQHIDVDFVDVRTYSDGGPRHALSDIRVHLPEF